MNRVDQIHSALRIKPTWRGSYYEYALQELRHKWIFSYWRTVFSYTDIFWDDYSKIKAKLLGWYAQHLQMEQKQKQVKNQPFK